MNSSIKRCELEPLRHDHAIDGAVGFEHDLALGQIEVERAALGARLQHGAIRGIERLQHLVGNGFGVFVGTAGDRKLRLLVMQFRDGADHHPMKGVRALSPVAPDHHAHGERRAVLLGPQRAQIVGNALRQHRHDAVGEIDRIAALDRFAVERRAGPHITGDVGDGDGDDMAAGIFRIGIGNAVHRVVVILGVGRIDGDERHIAPVLAARHGRGARRGGFVEHRGRKHVRNVVGVDGDEADGAFALDRAEPLDDGAGRQAELALARDVDGNEVAVGRTRRRIRRDAELAAELLLVDRHQPPAAGRQRAEDAERAMLGAVDQLDDAAGEFVVAGALDADQRAVADAAGFARLRPARRRRCG